MQRNGQKLAFPFLYMSASQTDTNVAQLLQQDWAKEGVQVTLRSLAFNQVIATASPSTPTKWTMASWGARWFYGSDYYPTGGGLYATGGSANSTMNTLIAQTYAPGTPAQEQQRLDAYQAYVAQQLPGLYLPESVGFGMPPPTWWSSRGCTGWSSGTAPSKATSTTTEPSAVRSPQRPRREPGCPGSRSCRCAVRRPP